MGTLDVPIPRRWAVDDTGTITFYGPGVQQDMAGVLTFGEAGFETYDKQRLDKMFVSPRAYGAHGDGTDDQTALALMLANEQYIDLENLTYGFSGDLVINSSQTVIGRGGMRVTGGGTVLKALSAASRVWVRGGGARVAQFAIDGNAVANYCLQVGGKAAGDADSDLDIAHLYVARGVVNNILIQGTQNSTMRDIRQQLCAGEGMVVDWSTGGWTFERIESNSNAGANLRLTQSSAHVGGYPGVSDNTFLHCIFEARTTDGPQVWLESSLNNSFIRCAIAASVHAGWTSGLVLANSFGPSIFDSCTFFGNAGQVPFELNTTAWFPSLVVDGLTDVGGITIGAFRTNDHGLIKLLGEVNQVSAGTLPLIDPASTGNYFDFSKTTYIPLYTSGTSSAQVIEQGKVVGEAQPRYKRFQDGGLLLGGGAAALETGIGRLANGGVNLVPRISEGVTYQALGASGVATVDASLGSTQTIFLNNFNMTGLTITNGVVGQRLRLIFQMGSAVSTFTLPLTAGNFLWQGGDVNVPKMDTAFETVTFALELGTSAFTGFWHEIGGPRRHRASHYRGGADDLFLKNWRVAGAARWRMMNELCLPTAAGSTPVSGDNTFQIWEVPEDITFDQWAVMPSNAPTGGTQTIGVAAYALSAAGLPTGSPILGLDTAAPVLNLVGATANARLAAALSAPLTVPKGRYALSTLTLKSGVATNASLWFVGGIDPRITYIGTPLTGAWSACYAAAGVASFGAVPALSNNTSVPPCVFFRQTA